MRAPQEQTRGSASKDVVSYSTSRSICAAGFLVRSLINEFAGCLPHVYLTIRGIAGGSMPSSRRMYGRASFLWIEPRPAIRPTIHRLADSIDWDWSHVRLDGIREPATSIWTEFSQTPTSDTCTRHASRRRPEAGEIDWRPWYDSAPGG